MAELTTPKNLTGITKDFMVEFIKTKDREDIEWFKKTCNDLVEEQTNNLTKEKVMGVNIKKLRKAFAERYFPELTKTKKKKGQTFLDIVNAL